VLLPENLGQPSDRDGKSDQGPGRRYSGRRNGRGVRRTLGCLREYGALAIPGVGPLIAAGPIMATLAGVGVGGAIGGITGALVGMGIPEYEAKRMRPYQKGGILLRALRDLR